MIRVLVAEDSTTIRQLLVEILASDPEVELVGTAANGLEVVRLAKRLRPDVITMDIEMPLLDGLQATKEIMIEAPTRIIVVSSASRGNVEMALNATRAGALMVLPTPSGPGSPRFQEERTELLRVVRSMAKVKVVRHWRQAVPARMVPESNTGAAVRLVALAASTGGPAALQRLLMDLPRDFPVPLLVVQHIARGFTEGLCTWLGRSCSLRVGIAKPHELLEPHRVYLGPDDHHLGVDAEGRVLLSDARPINGFRPSANFLFSSVARVYGQAAVGVVLTGMGSDGLEGARALHAVGGRVLAQDEESSIVYGMPKEVVNAGIVSSVLPIHGMAAGLVNLLSESVS